MADFDADAVREQMATALATSEVTTRSHLHYMEYAERAVAPLLPTAVRAVTDAVRELHSIPHWCQSTGGEEEVPCVASRQWFEADTEGRWRCPTLKLCDEIDKAAGVDRG